MDQIFGRKFFQQAHDVFQHAHFLYINRRDAISWHGQEGGVEGQRQQLWSVITICMVKYALSCFTDLGIEGSVFSYGDNVIAPLKIPLKGGDRDDFTTKDYDDLLQHRLQ